MAAARHLGLAPLYGKLFLRLDIVLSPALKEIVRVVLDGLQRTARGGGRVHESRAAVAAAVAAEITEAKAAAALEAHLRMPSTTAAMPSFDQLAV